MQEIGYGSEAIVYRKGRAAIKVYHALLHGNWEQRILAYASLQREQDVCKLLYAKGIRVPRPLGLHDVVLEAYTDEYKIVHPRTKVKAFVMQYINGPNGYHLQGTDLYDRAMASAIEEEERAKQLGMTTSDFANPGNFVWCKDSSYLVDFSHWRTI